jgi:hypothetical protein
MRTDPQGFPCHKQRGKAGDPDLNQEEARQQQELDEAQYLASLIPEEEME